ncbi:hypothetical protein B0T19DRAFT_85563 [Cercophora scortea]|uniref:Uncharacterized protein n=1 Tax=Cercophora scortea TaxID=314031 RepID=A0AAE0IV98_9PEZI|nr:hypothetical protein B0T19DRAFT_85563 [Cercophora scortea]
MSNLTKVLRHQMSNHENSRIQSLDEHDTILHTALSSPHIAANTTYHPPVGIQCITSIIQINIYLTSSIHPQAPPKHTIKAPPYQSKPDQNGAKNTYNTRDSLVVTHPTTSLAVACLSRAERTGCRVLKCLWSYVKVRATNSSQDDILKGSSIHKFTT